MIPDLVHGPEAIKLSVALYRAAFPDLHITVDEVIAHEDTVLHRWTAPSRGEARVVLDMLLQTNLIEQQRSSAGVATYSASQS